MLECKPKDNHNKGLVKPLNLNNMAKSEVETRFGQSEEESFTLNSNRTMQSNCISNFSKTCSLMLDEEIPQGYQTQDPIRNTAEAIPEANEMYFKKKQKNKVVIDLDKESKEARKRNSEKAGYNIPLSQTPDQTESWIKVENWESSELKPERSREVIRKFLTKLEIRVQ